MAAGWSCRSSDSTAPSVPAPAASVPRPCAPTRRCAGLGGPPDSFDHAGRGLVDRPASGTRQPIEIRELHAPERLRCCRASRSRRRARRSPRCRHRRPGVPKPPRSPGTSRPAGGDQAVLRLTDIAPRRRAVTLPGGSSGRNQRLPGEGGRVQGVGCLAFVRSALIAKRPCRSSDAISAITTPTDAVRLAPSEKARARASRTETAATKGRTPAGLRSPGDVVELVYIRSRW